jgi:amino acid transporter
MTNYSGSNFWLMGWLFFIGYNFAQTAVDLVWWEYIVSLVGWPAQLAHQLVLNGVM